MKMFFKNASMLLVLLLSSTTPTKGFEAKAIAVPRKIMSRENLVWSPRVLRRTAIHAAWIGVARAAFGNGVIESAQRMGVWTSMSLLSSSCCLVQVLLNFFSVGCAGFAILGPIRPLCLAAQAHMTLSAADPVIAAVALCVALSPELLVLSGRMRKKKSVPSRETTLVALSLPTMGCVACIDAVSRALRKVSNVEDVEIVLNNNEGTAKGGRATVTVASEVDDVVLRELRQACESAGFPTTTAAAAAVSHAQV